MNLEHVVLRREDGSIESERWYLDGKRHRLDGPAVVWYYEDGSIYSEGWYLDNKQLTKEEVEDLKIKLEIEKQIESWLV